MSVKEFLKPDKRKILLFIFLSISIILPQGTWGIHFYGYPLPTRVEASTVLGGNNFFIENLFVDLIFWFILSFSIIWIYDKVRKK